MQGFLLYIVTGQAESIIQQPVWADNAQIDVESKKKRPPVATTNQQGASETEEDSDFEYRYPNVRDARFARETHLIYPAAGGKIALGRQNIQIQQVARRAIQYLLVSMCFEDAFPNVAVRTKFNRDALYQAATELGFETIAERIKSYADYVEVLAGLVSSCNKLSVPCWLYHLLYRT